MNKETNKLYTDLLNYIFKFMKDIGDTQLICEGMLVDLIDSVKDGCAKEAGEYFDMDLYEKFCEDNRGRFHSGQFSEREIVMEFIEEAIKEE